MTQNRDRKQAIRARMAATGEPYTEAARHVGAGPSPAADPAGEHLAWSGPGWYAFPPEPPQGAGLGLGNGVGPTSEPFRTRNGFGEVSAGAERGCLRVFGVRSGSVGARM
jgi:hypothetical protein